MTMRNVESVRFPSGYHELFGRKVTSLTLKDGYRMQVHLESGCLLIHDPKEGQEVLVHTSRLESCVLVPEGDPKKAKP